MRPYGLTFALLLSAACGSETEAAVPGPEAGVDAARGDAGVGGDCSDAREIGSLADVRARVPGTFGASAFEVDQRVSGSLRATASFDLLFAELPLPADCVAPPAGRCTTEVIGGSFRDYPESRISFIDGGVRVEPGALFQLRFNLREFDGMQLAQVVLERAPCLPCFEGDLRCAEDASCYPAAAGSYCQSCLRGTATRCACWEEGDTYRTSGPCMVIPFAGPTQTGVCGPDGECRLDE